MNTIVILCDTLRRDHCGAYNLNGRTLNELGSTEQPNWFVDTLNMRRLAQRGTTFDNCWCGSTPCMPARRDIYTGRFEFLERGWGPLEEWDIDLPSQVSAVTGKHPHVGLHDIAQRGGRISQLITDHMCLWSKGSGNYHMGYTGFEFIRGHQWDNWITDPIDADTHGLCPANLNKGWYDRHVINNAQIRDAKGEDGYFAHQVFDAACDWLKRNREHKDFYLHLDCFDPHEPWDPPRELVEQFMSDAYEVPDIMCHAPYADWREAGLTEQQLRSYQARYAAMCVMVDRALGKLMQCMDELDLWKDTLVIFTTDHGTWNGERGRIGKLGVHQHDGGAHIPFVICHPDPGTHGQRREQLVQLVDIYPTTLAAVNRPMPEQNDNRPIHGVDLLPAVLDNSAPTRDYAVTGMFGHSVTITDSQWILHQSPVDDNRPLFWHGYTDSCFALALPLGPVVDDQREVLKPPGAQSFGPTWLSDKQTDPIELTNLAQDQPDELARLQAALTEELQRLKAPDWQLDRLGLAV